MTKAMWERVEHYLPYVAQGILSNHYHNTPNAQAFMEAKKLNPEKLAILSAIELVQQLEVFKQADANIEAKKQKPVLVES